MQDNREEPANGNPESNPAKDLKDFVLSWPFIGAALAVIGGAVWGKLSDTIIADYLLAIGFCAIVFLAAHKAFPNSGWIVRRGLPFVISLLVLLPTHFLLSGKSKNQEWPLHVVVKSPRFPSFKLELTNSALFQSRSKGGIMSFGWALVVPVLPEEKYATIRLILENPSTTESVDGFGLNFLYSETLEISPDTTAPPMEWKPVPSALNNATLGPMLGLGMDRKNEKLFATTGLPLNDIRLRPSGGFKTPARTDQYLFIMLATEATPQTGIALRLICPVSTIPEEPHLLPPGKTYKYRD
jgi:hypothetical protein